MKKQERRQKIKKKMKMKKKNFETLKVLFMRIVLPLIVKKLSEKLLELLLKK